MEIFQQISEALQRGDVKTVQALVTQALTEGAAPKTVLDKGLLAGMDVVGQKFKNNEIYIPEVMISARAMSSGMAILKPRLVQENVASLGKVILGTVQGDHHDIGKNLVKMMLEGAGFEVIDLGVNVTPAKFVDAVREHGAAYLGMSALLTTTMMNMKQVLNALRDAGLRERVTAMVGGAPVTEDFAVEIGADFYAADAASCAERLKEMAQS